MISPRIYRYMTISALAFLCVIIVSGAAVRLTGSGLGCTDWPNCTPGRLTPHSASDVNAMIEFVNRVFTGFVSVAVIVAVLGACFRRPFRRDLLILSLGLVAGVIGQIVLGGITVLFELAPQLVAGHFILSLILVWNAIALVRRSGQDPVARTSVVAPNVRNATRILVVLAWIVVVTGTVVTGSGPHAGDLDAKRYNFALPDVARVHGVSVSVFLFATIISAVLIWRTRADQQVKRAVEVLLGTIVIQAVIGYTQYFTGVPAWLVALHIAGSVAVFLSTIQLSMSTYRREASRRDAPAPTDIVRTAAPASA